MQWSANTNTRIQLKRQSIDDIPYYGVSYRAIHTTYTCVTQYTSTFWTLYQSATERTYEVWQEIWNVVGEEASDQDKSVGGMHTNGRLLED